MGKKKDAATHGMSKAERKALEQKEAELMRELHARAEKPKKKAKEASEPDLSTLKKKALRQLIADKTNGKTLRGAARDELARRDTSAPVPEKAKKSKPSKEERATADTARAERKAKAAKPVKPEAPKKEPAAGVSGAETHSPAAIVEAADRVLNDPNASEDALKSARKAKGKALESMTDDDLKERVQTKATRREALLAAADSIDRADNEAVKEYNAQLALLGGGTFLTSDAERAAIDERLKADGGLSDEAIAAVDGAIEALEFEMTKLEKKAAKKAKAQQVEEVETDRGRVFEAGEPVAAVVPDPAEERGFAIPSDGGFIDFDVNGNNQYKVKRPEDGKEVGYTRVTTYIGTNEDRSQIEKWKLRILLEGVAINDTPDESGRIDEPVVAKVRDLLHRRDVAIAKARKQDRKGKLVVGQLATIVDAAWSEFKRDLNDLAETLLDTGGAHEASAKGTALHELTELYDREGIDAVGEKLERGEISPADLADVEAYARALENAGIKILPEYIEQPVVRHDIKVAGRVDRIVLAKLPGAQRATRMILDTKSGRIDLGAGKIAQQLELYSSADPYDLETHETLPPHKASRTKALVLHLPAGSAEAHIYVVDLGTGRVGNDISAKVRQYRRDGRRAIDTKVDLAAPKAAD